MTDTPTNPTPPNPELRVTQMTRLHTQSSYARSGKARSLGYAVLQKRCELSSFCLPLGDTVALNVAIDLLFFYLYIRA